MTGRWKFQKIEEQIPANIQIEYMGGGCPWQAEGYLDGQQFYARFRSNQASLTVYEDEEMRVEKLSSVVSPYFEDERALDGFAGVLDTEEEVVEFFRILIAALAPTSEENPSGKMIMARYIRAALAESKEGTPQALTFLNAIAAPGNKKPGDQ